MHRCTLHYYLMNVEQPNIFISRTEPYSDIDTRKAYHLLNSKGECWTMDRYEKRFLDDIYPLNITHKRGCKLESLYVHFSFPLPSMIIISLFIVI